LAFAPGGDVAYINYTDNSGDTVISEHPVEGDGTFGTGDLARVVLQIDQPYDNHNGGGLRFGPDGFLYVGMGDGGAGGDPERRATDMATPLGKMLRIDPAIAVGEPYSVPPDNPFVGTPAAAPEIWSSGLRNPWRFSFDRETGDLWIADVGQNAWEEINVAPATGGVDAGKGLSFGWSAFEGDERYNEDVSPDGHTPPIATYGHDGGRCSISGGVRVRGGPVPALEGWYVYADYCSGQVWALEVTGEGADLAAGRTVELGLVEAATALVAGPTGEVYALSRDGPVYRLDPP
jgi:glucose/arabinose dehydrogenase